VKVAIGVGSAASGRDRSYRAPPGLVLAGPTGDRFGEASEPDDSRERLARALAARPSDPDPSGG
jgi:hypothetical protein